MLTFYYYIVFLRWYNIRVIEIRGRVGISKMPMKKDEHENLLNELLSEGLQTSRKTEILQQLRVDYGSVIDEHKQLSESNQSMKAVNEDLVVSNSKLFRQLGYENKNEPPKETKEKDFSETITIEALEKQA